MPSETLSDQLVKKMPELPVPLITTYILYYRQGNNPHPQFLFFTHSSNDMKIISERAKRHCEVMNYRFVYVRPAFVDLDKSENLLLNRD